MIRQDQASYPKAHTPTAISSFAVGGCTHSGYRADDYVSQSLPRLGQPESAVHVAAHGPEPNRLGTDMAASLTGNDGGVNGD